MSEKNNNITTIQISKTTKELLDEIMPKKWSYDECVSALANYWRKSVGKHPEDHKASGINT